MAACLQDSLLTSININTGFSASLLGYSQINSGLQIPITICSLSKMDNFVFIGYSKIEYNQEKVNKTNIVIKLKITYDSSGAPILDNSFQKKFYQFPSLIKTPSAKQISCEPLKYTDTNFRLVCVYEDLRFDENFGSLRYYILGASMNENFDGFFRKKNL